MKPPFFRQLSSTKIDPFANPPVVEEGNPDNYPDALAGKPRDITTKPPLEPIIDTSILGDEGTPDDLLLAFSEAFLSADEPVQPPPNANVATTSVVVNRSPSAAVMRCLRKAYRRFVMLPKGGYKPIPSTVLSAPRLAEFTAQNGACCTDPWVSFVSTVPFIHTGN